MMFTLREKRLSYFSDLANMSCLGAFSPCFPLSVCCVCVLFSVILGLAAPGEHMGPYLHHATEDQLNNVVVMI